MQRHIENTQVVAEWLEQHPSVESVSYAGLTSSKWHALAKKYAPKGPGAVLSFELKGGIEAGKKFVEGLKLFSHVANIGDVRSLVIHPASTTHSQLNEKEQQSAGITPGLVRLSIGLENLPDIKADLEVGFAASRQGL
jgi:O-acetylhomoserine (thiol)-lyase